MATLLPPSLVARPRPEPPAGTAAPADRACPNCGTPAPLAYCPACGQAQHEAHRSLRSIAGDLLDTFAGWDGKIPVTLWLLVRHPGRLTAEYVAGRRVRYLPPLRLYLLLSVLLVLAFHAARPRMRGLRINMAGGAGAHVTATRGAAPPPAPAPLQQTVPPGPWQKLKRSYFGDRITALERMSKEDQQRELKRAFLAKLGNMFFALVPGFALVVGALYFRGPMVYAEHLVFALHVHAFAAAALALALGLRAVAPPALAVAVLLWIPAYLFVALRTVYGGSRRRTLVKLALLGGSYLLTMSVAMVLTVLVAFLVG